MKTTTLIRTDPPAVPADPPVRARDAFLSWARGWDRFWFRPADPTTLGFMRICFGIIALYVHLSYTFDLLSYVGPEAWMDEKGVEYVRHQMPVYAPATTWTDPPQLAGHGQFTWSIYFHVHDTFWIYVTHFSILVILFLFTIGWATRVTSVLAWAGILSYIHRSPNLLFGMDAMMVIGATYLMIGPSGAALSVDRWLERRRGGSPTPTPSSWANFTYRLFQIHFCFIYMASGLSKMLGSSWWNGNALWGTMANYSFAPMQLWLYYDLLVFLCKHRWLWEMVTTAGVIFTLVLEIGLPFMIWYRPLRWTMICCSILLHTGIALTMGLVTFGLFMMVLVSSFIPPEAIRHFVRSLEATARQLLYPREKGQPPGRRKDKTLALTR